MNRKTLFDEVDWFRLPGNIVRYCEQVPIIVASRSKTSTVFAQTNAGIVCSNPTRNMDVCVHLFCVCVVLCVSSGLTTG
jgi:hypothetical protein